MDFRTEGADQPVLLPYLPVDLTANGYDALPFQRTGNGAFVNGGDGVQPSLGVAAVVDAFRKTGTLQIAVCYIFRVRED